MSLKQKLEEIHVASRARVPAEKYAIMARATDDLRNSGALANVAAVGQKAPQFAGTSHDGRAIAHGDLLGRKPVVLSFFRGHW